MLPHGKIEANLFNSQVLKIPFMVKVNIVKSVIDIALLRLAAHVLEPESATYPLAELSVGIETRRL